MRMSVSHTHGPGGQGEKHRALSENRHTPAGAGAGAGVGKSPPENAVEIFRGCSSSQSSLKSPSRARRKTGCHRAS